MCRLLFPSPPLQSHSSTLITHHNTATHRPAKRGPHCNGWLIYCLFSVGPMFLSVTLTAFEHGCHSAVRKCCRMRTSCSTRNGCSVNPTAYRTAKQRRKNWTMVGFGFSPPTWLLCHHSAILADNHSCFCQCLLFTKSRWSYIFYARKRDKCFSLSAHMITMFQNRMEVNTDAAVVVECWNYVLSSFLVVLYSILGCVAIILICAFSVLCEIGWLLGVSGEWGWGSVEWHCRA